MWTPWGNEEDEDDIRDVDEVVEAAEHKSVTETVLTETYQSRWILPDRGWLYDQPLIRYLADDELCHFIFETKDALSTGTPGDFEPDDPYRGYFCVTDKRILIAVGQEPENSIISVNYDRLREFSAAPGLSDPDEPKQVGVYAKKFYPAFRVQTADERLEFSVSSGVTIDDIEKVARYIVAQAELPGWPHSAYWRSMKNQRERKQERQEREKQREERRKKREAQRRQRELKKLADWADSQTVTVDRLRPVYDSLRADEKVLYILTEGKQLMDVRDDVGGTRIRETYEQEWTAVTTDRILLSNENGTEVLRYEVINETAIRNLKTRDDAEQIFLELRTDDLLVYFSVSEVTSVHLQEMVSKVRELAHPTEA